MTTTTCKRMIGRRSPPVVAQFSRQSPSKSSMLHCHHYRNTQCRRHLNTHEVWERAREWTKRTSRAVQDRGRQAAHSASQRAQEAAASFVLGLQESAKRRVQRSLSATKEYAHRHVESAKQTTVDTVSSARQSIADVATSGVDAGKAVVNESMERVASGIGETKRSTVRSFWWWSLSAIGILGLAMSIPREIRLALENRQKRLEQDSKSAQNRNRTVDHAPR